MLSDKDSTDEPTVRIQGRDSYSQMMTEMARSLKYSGNPDLAELILQDKARLNSNVPTAINKLANDEVSDAIDLIEAREYKSKSGYHGNGNLRNSITKTISKDGLTAEIFPTALSSDGKGTKSKSNYKYGRAFENGLKNKNYPAQHPMHDSGIKLDVNKYDKNILDSSFK